MAHSVSQSMGVIPQALTEIALLKWLTNMSLVSEDCQFAVQLSRGI